MNLTVTARGPAVKRRPRPVGRTDHARRRVRSCRDLVIGIIGAVIGMWLLPRLGVHLGAGLVEATVNATIGALLLLVIIKLVRDQGGRGDGWRGRWSRRW